MISIGIIHHIALVASVIITKQFRSFLSKFIQIEGDCQEEDLHKAFEEGDQR